MCSDHMCWRLPHFREQGSYEPDQPPITILLDPGRCRSRGQRGRCSHNSSTFPQRTESCHKKRGADELSMAKSVVTTREWGFNARRSRSPSDGLKGKTIRIVLQDFEQVLLHVLEYEVELPFPSECFLEAHNVGVPQHSQHLHLPQGRLLDDLVILCTKKLIRCKRWREMHNIAGARPESVCKEWCDESYPHISP